MVMRVLKKQLWPHCVKIKDLTDDSIYDIENWLGEKLGIFKGQWNVVHGFSASDYYFKKGPDATMFALRWS
jgi:hypothetical protein